MRRHEKVILNTVLDLRADPIELTAALIDIPSQSRDEAHLADEIEQALHACSAHLEIIRDGNAIIARTHQGHGQRVMLAGHLDTVPVAENIPHHYGTHLSDAVLYGCGASDMKSGLAVFLHLAATLTRLAYDVTYLFYECEEIEASANGLGRLQASHRDYLEADLVILGEPTSGLVEAGCQGTIRAVITSTGVRAHSARSWMGENAIHRLAGPLQRLVDYHPRQVSIDGCQYREGLSAVAISGGVAGNVIPDQASLTVNFRFAPDRSLEEACEHLQEIFADTQTTLTITDSAPGALPGLSAPLAQQFLACTRCPPRAKYGWTDVARFAHQHIPAINFGPGDPNMAHRRDEYVYTDQITHAVEVIREFLSP